MQSTKFIQSQYEKGVSIREDIYNTQFSIIFSQQLTAHAVTKINIKRKFKSISEAVLFIERFVNKKDSNNRKFKANTVAIIDRYLDNVIVGEINHFNKLIEWFCPVSVSHELNQLLDMQSGLYEQADYEYFYDEIRSYGDSLTIKANKLNNFICSKKYINCKEIKALTFRFFFPNVLI